jgi:RecB family exonuclease
LIINNISHSRIELFKQCQYKYRLLYHDKIKSPLPEEQHFVFGKFIHKMLELIVKDKLTNEIAINKSLEMFSNLDRSYLEKLPNIIRHFDYFQKQIYNEDFLKETTEETFELPVFDGEFVFKGVIDRKIFYKNGKVLIIDYKTSQKKNQIKKELANQNPQLIIYTWASNLTEKIDIDNIHSMLFYLNSGNTIFANPNKKTIELCINDICKTAMEIKNLIPELAKPNPGPLCNYCEYRTICKYFKF